MKNILYAANMKKAVVRKSSPAADVRKRNFSLKLSALYSEQQVLCLVVSSWTRGHPVRHREETLQVCQQETSGACLSGPRRLR